MKAGSPSTPVDSPHKGPVMQESFSCRDVVILAGTLPCLVGICVAVVPLQLHKAQMRLAVHTIALGRRVGRQRAEDLDITVCSVLISS